MTGHAELLAELADAERLAELRDAERTALYAAEALVAADAAGTVTRKHVDDLAALLDTLAACRSHYIAGSAATVSTD